MRKVIIILCLLFYSQQSHAQLVAKPASELLAALKQDISGEMKVQLLLQLTLYYYFDQTEVKPNQEKIFFYLQQAQKFNNGAHAAVWQNELNCYWGKYFLLKGNTKKSKEYFDKISADIGNSGDPDTQTDIWRKLAGNIRELDTLGITRNQCFLNLMALYKTMGRQENVIEMEKAIADTHLKQGNLDIAEIELSSVLEKYKAIGYKRLHYTYNLISAINWFKGNYNTALHYALLTVKSMRNTQDTSGIINFYCHLAGLYDELGQEQKSSENFSIAFSHIFPNHTDFYNIRSAGKYARVLIKQRQFTKALKFINDFVAQYPPVDSYGKASLAETLAWYYNCIGNLEKYEQYNLELISLSPLLLKNNEITEEVAYDLGNYFLNKKEFAQATLYFNHALAEASYVNSVLRKKDVYLMLYKTDSARGDYLQAIKNMNHYTWLSDSIFTIVKNRQLQEVQVQYETEKKDKDLAIKDKNIQLLTKQSQLQLANLRTERNTRNMFLICTGLLILLLALGYNRFKLKQKNNVQLEEQQIKINEKNIHLQHLLKEKEWLVKEIHHRVKNNFHTVISLLGTHSGYLKNKDAIAAMAESQQRIQSMSLIHQKLYQRENMSDIDMIDYIHELVDYLKESFNTDRRIRFHFELHNIELGVYHAIPIGLILNEIITNAIKYAFPKNREGNIHIAFTKNNNGDRLLLVVKDDGVGLPAGFSHRTNNTMGMNLMKGLSKDIDGQFSIQHSYGIIIKIAFPYSRDLNREHFKSVKEKI